MKTIAIVGYSNSGKSSVARAIVAEAARRGMAAAAIKVGHHSAKSGPAQHDSERLAAAGADPVAYRGPDGWNLQISQPLEERDQPLHIPAWLTAALDGVDLLVVEGRQVNGAALIQTVGANGEYKLSPEMCDLVLDDVPRNPLPAGLLRLLAD